MVRNGELDTVLAPYFLSLVECFYDACERRFNRGVNGLNLLVWRLISLYAVRLEIGRL